MKKTTVAYAIALALTSKASYSEPLQEDHTKQNSSISEFVQNTFEPPESPDDAPKGRTRGSGSR